MAGFMEKQADKKKQCAAETQYESRWTDQFGEQIWEYVGCQRPSQKQEGREPRNVEADSDAGAAEETQALHRRIKAFWQPARLAQMALASHCLRLGVPGFSWDRCSEADRSGTSRWPCCVPTFREAHFRVGLGWSR
jgi:hypothetical protein